MANETTKTTTPPPPSTKAEEKKPADTVDDDAPDPDEDDLDDLDDMLQEFSTVRLDSQKPAPAPAGPGRPFVSMADEPAAAPATNTTNTTAADLEPTVEDVLNDEEFAKQLQAGMADLLGELEKSPDMQAQFEDMFKQLSATAAETAAAADAGPSPEAAREAADDASFQETIRRTMERMQASGDQATATAAAAAAAPSDDLMADMMRQFGGAGGLDGASSDEDFSKMLVGMMEQLTAREILYEPMKELDDKFPAWLAQHRAGLPADDLARYEEQRGFVRSIVAKFEEPGFSDSNTADREYIVDLMQKMQAAGAPPPDLVGDMESAQEAFNAPEESCNPQ